MLDLDQQLKSLKAEICKTPTGRGVIQFVVGEPSANTLYSRGENELGDLTLLEIPTDATTRMIINECCIVVDSVVLFKDGALVHKGRSDRLSVETAYTNMRAILTLTPSFKQNSIYTIRYEYHK